MISCHTLYHVLTWCGEGEPEDRYGAVKQPTHGERLYRVAVANAVATSTGAATRHFQMILASSSQIFHVRSQALGIDTSHIHWALCLNSWAIDP